MSEEPPAMPSVESIQSTAVPRTSKAAIWSLVFGVSSFCLWILGSIPALILGIIAMNKIHASQGKLEGKGLAIAGMVTGGLGMLMGIFWVAVFVGMTMPSFSGVLDKAKITAQIGEVRFLAITCREYAAEHDGNYPADLNELYPDYLDDKSMLKTFGKSGSKDADYIYFPGYREDSKTKTKPLIATPVAIMGDRVMALVGGDVVEVPEEEFQRLMSVQ